MPLCYEKFSTGFIPFYKKYIKFQKRFDFFIPVSKINNYESIYTSLRFCFDAGYAGVPDVIQRGTVANDLYLESGRGRKLGYLNQLDANPYDTGCK